MRQRHRPDCWSGSCGTSAGAGKWHTVFYNGIDASTYTGGDGSFGRYAKDGIKLGLIEAYPVNFTDDSGQRTGWNTNMVMASVLGHVGIAKVDFIIGPFQTLVPGLQSSRFDLLASDVHVTAERVKVIDSTAPVLWYGDTLAVPQGNPANLHSWADLAGHVVGVGLGSNYAEMLQQRTDLADLKLYQDTSAIASDLGRRAGLCGGGRGYELRGIPGPEPPANRYRWRLRCAFRSGRLDPFRCAKGRQRPEQRA